MNKRIAIALFFCLALTVSADNPPSEASIKQLLEVTHARKLLDTMLVQLDTYMTQAMQQATKGQHLTADMQKRIDKEKEDFASVMKEMLDWSRLEPMYIRIYQKSFTQEEIDSQIVMYQTPGGQAVLNKMPLVMQNMMAEMQEMMKPLMERIQHKQQEIAAEIQKGKHKTGG